MTRFPPRALRLAALLAATTALLQPVAASAQTARALAGAPMMSGTGLAPAIQAQTVSIDLAGASTPTRTLQLPKGKMATVDLPTDARDVVVSDPKVADVNISTMRRIYVTGVAAGQTDATFIDGAGRQILRLNIRVDQDTTALSDTLNRLLPGAAIRVEPVADSIVLTGEVQNAAAADRAVRLAQAFVAKPDQVVNMLSVGESEQVMLKVRIVEVNRSVIKQLGVNLSAVIGQIGGTQFNFANAATYGVSGALLGGLAGGYNLDTTQQPEIIVPCAAGTSGTCYQVVKPGNPTYVSGNSGTTISNPSTATAQTTVGSNGLNKASSTLGAFERAGLVRSLAEPDLVTVSGEAGHFLVGGEFPVPVGLDNSGRVTVEFKQYGVGLGFTPIVLSKGRISLKLSAEVSELNNSNGFTLGGATTAGSSTPSPSLVIPGLNVRRVENSVELPSGQSLMIAGLLQSNAKQTLDSLPGVQNLPILGALFRSRDFVNNETELVVIVTPYLVKPTAPGNLQTPADGLELASDLETTMFGRLNKSFGKPAAAPRGGAYQGPVGYVVD
jgi:pilus assembly protein CpaC